MPVIEDNKFSSDSYGTRSERLIAIQGNFASIQPELQAPAAIATWSATCHEVYLALWGESQAEEGESKGATHNVSVKLSAMETLYQKARTIAQTLYRDDPDNYDEFKFDLPFPDSRNDKLGRVETVLNANAHHIVKGITHLIPATIITELTTAREDYIESVANQDSERSDAFVATKNLQRRYDDDTKKLQDLRNWWYTILGKDDPRITLIGMVNPQSGGNTGPVPPPPSNLTYLPAYPGFTWDAVEGATSYEVQHKVATAPLWNIIYSGIDTTLLHVDSVGNYVARLRSRNANGFGSFGTELAYSVTPPQPD